MSEPVDEGIKHFAHSLIESCPEEYKVLGLAVRAPRKNGNSHTVSLKTNRLFLNYSLWERIRHFQPSVICYLPSASATLFSFLRSRILKLQYVRARVVMVSLQSREYGWLARHLIRLFSPDTVFVQNEQAMQRLASLGCNTRLLPSGVDLKKFVPASAARKAELRAKYGLDPKAYTILHVGHLTQGRNVELMIRARQEHNAQVILVSSGLRHEDRDKLNRELKENGVIVMDRYIPEIEEMYQLSDCYLFPVFSNRACIGVPLSVLEAMACNIPVVSVKYGTLPKMFEAGNGLVFADSPDELMAGLARVRNLENCRTREKVIPYSWQAIARFILEQTANEVKN
ncbi:MAG: glycosyltransferase family 4 protein [Dehalococcoidales bacterium]